MGAYLPERSCFEMRLQLTEWRVEGVARVPAPPRLRGAFRTALDSLACSADVEIAAFAAALLGTHCPVQGDLPAPVTLRAAPGAAGLRLVLALWGRTGRAARTVARAAVEEAARRLGASAVSAAGGTFEGTLGGWVTTRGVAPGSVATVELLSPVDTEGKPPELAELLGNLGCELVRCDLADRGFAGPLGKERCDALADRARAAARGSLEGVAVHSSLGPPETSRRRSGSNGQRFLLGGRRGGFTLEGPLAGAWPWLAALALRGAGRHRAFGLGHARVVMGRQRLEWPGENDAAE